MFIGSIYMFAGATAPAKFLVCDGSAVSRSTYSDLFAVVGTVYGDGDGSSTFNLPNLSGRVAIGSSLTHSLGSTGGSETVSLDSSSLPSHIHTVAGHTHESTIAATTPSLSHTITTQPSFNYNRPNSTRTCYTPTSQSSYSGTTSTNATLSTKVGVADHPATACTMSGGITECGALSTEESGDGNGHNNMQPYVTMQYIIYSGV